MPLDSSAKLSDIIALLQGFVGLGDNAKADLAAVIGGSALSSDNLETLITKLKASVPSANVLSGTTIASILGTMINNTSTGKVITPGTTDIVIPQGYFGGVLADGKVSGDSNFVEANIALGKVIWGKTGTYSSPHGSQSFSTSGTFNFFVPDGVTRIRVILVGGGGGGAVGTPTASSEGPSLCGGNSGTAVIADVPVTPGSTHSVTIGTGGNGGYVPGANYFGTGANGYSSSFDSIIATGGAGGNYSSSGIIQQYNSAPTKPTGATASYSFGLVFCTNNASSAGIQGGHGIFNTTDLSSLNTCGDGGEGFSNFNGTGGNGVAGAPGGCLISW